MSAIDLIYKPVYANLLKKDGSETPICHYWVFLLDLSTGRPQLKLLILRVLSVKLKRRLNY
jgi:hypothetical protein